MLEALISEVGQAPDSRNDLLLLLSNAVDPETGKSMDAIDLRNNLLTFITAGHETTALALTWTFYLLSLHLEVERRVRQEIDSVTAGAPNREARKALEPTSYPRLQDFLDASNLSWNHC